MMFCDTALAARIESAEAQLIAEWNAVTRRRLTGGFAMPVAGGVASFAEPASPINKVAGLMTKPDPTALETIEHAFAGRGAPVNVEVASLADPDLLEVLAERGYRLLSFENVLGRPLGDPVERITPPGIEVRRTGDDEFETWLDVTVEATLHPDMQGVPWHEEFPREILENAERDTVDLVQRYVATLDGKPAGGGSLRLTNGIAQLTGAATAPAFRRRGIHSALLAHRLADATAAGCDVAVITVQPGSKSQQNAQRS